MQLLANWLPSAPESFVRLAARWAPHVTIIVECGISLLLAIPGRAGRIGIVLGILLHGLIAVTPPPHNIAGYGIRIISRYLLLIPVAANRTERELSDALRGAGPVLPLAIAVAIVGATATVFGTAWPGIEPPVTDWLIPAFVALALFVGRAAYLSEEAEEVPTRKRTSPKLTAIVTFEAFVFVFGLIFFGLADNFPPKPFSNIRIHGGSNHFFVSTNILERTIPSDIVRVEFTSSQHINQLVPAELTHILDLRARNLLQFVGHSGRVFGPAAARAISPDFGAPNGDPFIRYTLPSFELRRLLEEARQLGEMFTLEYTHLPGYDASSPHLQTSSIVRLIEDGRGGRTCQVVDDNTTTGCPANEPAIQPPPPRWTIKTMVFWPNIILDDDQVGHVEGHMGYCFLE